MAFELVRGCGYRRIGGMYLCGGYISAPCDRLPYELKSCPVCGAGIHFTRSMTEINPLKLFGMHDDPEETGLTKNIVCGDRIRPCKMCDPTEEPAYIMTVGKKYYTPETFLEEAQEMGVSKRIGAVPKKLEFGKTIIYLAHPEAVNGLKQPSGQGELLGEDQPRLVDAEKIEKRLGIFCAFVPDRVEKLIWESQATPEELEKLEKRGITPIVIPDGDKDHA